MLITAEGDADLAPFRAGEHRLGARLWLVGAPTRIRAAGHLAETGRRVADVLAGAERGGEPHPGPAGGRTSRAGAV